MKKIKLINKNLYTKEIEQMINVLCDTIELLTDDFKINNKDNIDLLTDFIQTVDNYCNLCSDINNDDIERSFFNLALPIVNAMIRECTNQYREHNIEYLNKIINKLNKKD